MLYCTDSSQWRSQNILWGGAFHKLAELSNLILRGCVLNIGVAYNELNMHKYCTNHECNRIAHGPLVRF